MKRRASRARFDVATLAQCGYWLTRIVLAILQYLQS